MRKQPDLRDLASELRRPPAATTSDSAVELLSVSKSFGTTVAVDNVSLAVGHGKFFSVLGPSGCGKTTTLRVIGGFERATTGRIEISGRDVSDVPPNRRPVNTVFQSYALFNHLDVGANVGFGLREAHVARREATGRIEAALELVRLTGYAGRRTSELSGGEQQRVALARALILRPALLLLDEPLAALDLKLRKNMQVELKTLQREVGITFLYVTHDQEEALAMSDSVAVMNRGRIDQVGSPRELYYSPASRFVAEFVGEGTIFEGTVRHAHLETASGLTIPVPDNTPDGPASLLVRPEAITVAAAADAADSSPGALKAVVASVDFSGADCVVAVDLRDGTRSIARGRDHELAELRRGDDITIAWDRERSRVLPPAPEPAIGASSPSEPSHPDNSAPNKSQ